MRSPLAVSAELGPGWWQMLVGESHRIQMIQIHIDKVATRLTQKYSKVLRPAVKVPSNVFGLRDAQVLPGVKNRPLPPMWHWDRKPAAGHILLGGGPGFSW